MYVLINTTNMQLRGVFKNKNDVVICEDKVATPTDIFMDLNWNNSILRKYDKELPENWKKHSLFYDVDLDKFRRVMSNGNRQLVFIEE